MFFKLLLYTVQSRYLTTMVIFEVCSKEKENEREDREPMQDGDNQGEEEPVRKKQ